MEQKPVKGISQKAKIRSLGLRDDAKKLAETKQNKIKVNNTKIAILFTIALIPCLTLKTSNRENIESDGYVYGDGYMYYPDVFATTTEQSMADEINIYNDKPINNNVSVLNNNESGKEVNKQSGRIYPGSVITSGYGYRRHPILGGWRKHKGIDFKAKHGDPVRAAEDGVVVYSGWSGGYGKVVDIKHSNGYMTRYAHNSKLSVKVGDKVKAGQTIAKAGSTGRSTGPHVHFEVHKNGKVVDPMPFLKKKN